MNTRSQIYVPILLDPTIKYFHDGDSEGEDYQGGRDFDSLKAFVEEELEEKCDIADGSGCTDKEKGYIEKMKAKASDERVKQIKRLATNQGTSNNLKDRGLATNPRPETNQET